MKVNIWSPSFKLKNGERGYLEDSDITVPDDIKIGDIIYMYNGRFKCVVKDISILCGKIDIQLEVVD